MAGSRTGSSRQRSGVTRLSRCPPGARATWSSRWCTAPPTSTGSSPRSKRWARGDHLFFTDWRGDPDQLMRPGGPTIPELFSAAAERGVVVKGLLWRSHLDKLQFSEEENRHLGEAIERGRRRGAARPAGPPRRLASPEAGRAAAPGGAASATSRSPAASTCATAAATTPPTTATRSRWAWRTLRARTRPGTMCSWRCADRSSARWTPPSASGGTIRRRWTRTRRSHGCRTGCAAPT